MPTYQYRCPSCGYEFEEFQAITEDPISVCPRCKGKTQRLISGGAGLLFKGSGFYATDYRSKDYKKRAREEMPSTSSSDSSATPSSGTSDSSKPSTAGDKAKGSDS